MSISHGSSVIPRVADPFENEAQWTPYEVLEVAVVALTLFPVRLVLLAALIVLDFVLAKCVTLGMTLVDEGGCLRHEEPIESWQRALLWIIWATNRAQLWCLGFWTVKVEDRRKDRRRCANLLVGGPHMALTDVFVIAHAFPPMPGGVGKAEMARLPFLSAKGIAAQSVFLDRRNPDSRATCKKTIAKRARADWRGTQLIIFPEGTTTNGRVFIQFKLGAFLPGEPVQPFALHYPRRHCDLSWVGKNSNMLAAALRLMCQARNSAKITMFDTYVPDEAEQADPALYAANVRRLLAAELSIKTTEHTYDDVFLSLKLQEANVASDFEVESVRKLYNFDAQQLAALLQKFRKLDREKLGTVACTELCRALDLGGTNDVGARSPASVTNLRAFLSDNSSGVFSFREFVQVAALLSGKCSLWIRRKFAFLIFDLEGTGKLSVEMLRRTSLAQGNSSSEGLFAGVQASELSFTDFEELAERQPDLQQHVMEAVEGRFGRFFCEAEDDVRAKKVT